MVIIVGFGRVGQNLALFLEKIQQPYIGIDIDAALVKCEQSKHHRVIFGDATHPEILKAINITKARAMIISFEHMAETKIALHQARALSQTLPIIVRSQNEQQRRPLIELGATTVITAMFEESLAFADYLMHTLDVPETEIDTLIEMVRKEHYAALHVQ